MPTIRMFKYSRTSTLILLNNIDASIWDIQPDKFPNNIRWNAGHIYAEAEGFLHDADHEYEIIRPDWQDLFTDGTRPSEWTITPPSMQELIDALQEQDTRIESFFQHKLDNPTSKVRDVNGLMLETAEDAMQFITWHEGIHIGDIKSLRNLLK